MPSASAGMMRAGNRRVVAGLGGDQALDRALAELLAAPCSRASPRHTTTRPPCPRPRRAGCRRRRRSRPSAARFASSATRRRSAAAPSRRCSTSGLAAGAVSTVRISAKPNAPTSAGISAMPPARSFEPKVKRLKAWIALLADLRRRTGRASPSASPSAGPRRSGCPTSCTPNTPSQKNSKAPNVSATSASSGVNSARQTTPNSEPMTEPVVAMPIARPAWPLRASA